MDAQHHRELIESLMATVEEETGGEIVPDRSVAGAGSIRDLGMSSLVTLQFLVAVEDRFGIEWNDEVDSSVLASFDAMAQYLVAQSAQGVSR